MADVVNFRLAPWLRCAELVQDSPRTWCGARATHVRSTVSDFPIGYFCPLHRRRGDTWIADSVLFRRVSLQLEVLLSGVNLVPQDCEHEAVELVGQALERVGALVNLVTVTSAVGRYSPPAGHAGGGPRRGGR